MGRHQQAYTGDASTYEQFILDTLADKENGFDLVIVESFRPIAFNTFMRLQSHIQQAGIPVVLHDGEDGHQFPDKMLEAIKPDLFLKRELLADMHASWAFEYKGVPTIGFPFSAPYKAIQAVLNDPTLIDPEQLDISFFCGHTHTIRQTVANMLRAWGRSEEDINGKPVKVGVAISPDSDRNHAMDERTLLPWELYIKTMATSKLAISTRGFGFDTVRFWEASAVTCVATMPQNLLYSNPPSNNSHMFEFNQGNMIDVCRKALLNPELLHGVRNCGIAHTTAFHTNEARVRHLFGYMNDINLIEWVQEL
jgi:hypothetical protein